MGPAGGGVMGMYQHVQSVADLLTEHGIPATTEPRDLRTPGVWVTVDRTRPSRLCGTHETVVSVVLVARDTGHRHALAHLSDLLDKVLGVVVPDGDVVADTITLPAGGSPLPAMTFTTTVL